MNILDVVIIIAIIILIYKYYETYHLKNNNTEVTKDNTEVSNVPEKKKKKKKVQYTLPEKIKLPRKREANPYLTEVQFHNDYRDTANAFQILIPSQKNLFNRADMPILKTSTPPNNELRPLVKNFIREVNKILDKNVCDGYKVKNWKDNYGERDYKSGWEKQQERLGLPGSIYTNPAKKAHIRLIKVDHAEKYETEDELRYVLFMNLQKVNVEDQMVVRVSFQIDKQDYDINKDFFNKKKKTYNTIVKIEEIFVLGYLTKESFGKQSIKSKYYNFDGISNTDGQMFSQKEIITQLNNKRREYEAECVS
jgi:hypothetical protein